ncbi:unnamed protein product [Caenorhabditis bovis]|uniref:Uncharacterized protein n=1 Tax=Caenorhabditis bovis TaxID=2654633 RepID=A0A8S1E6V1_9PELO|nr:unnamed protein product [Caenorhabditis bovis]
MEDNRHFYRIPKRPQVLRQRWLSAIGRTEETVVSQVDKQIKIELPPKENKSEDRRRKQQVPSRFSGDSSASGSPSYLKKNRSIRDFYLPLSSTPTFDPSHSPHQPPATTITDPKQTLNDILSMASAARMNAPSGSRPLVALLDGRDCAIEMPILKDVATVAFCDAQSTQEIHEKVLNEAVAALMYHSIKLGREDLEKFKLLKVVFRIGNGIDNIDVKAATELGIAVCHAEGDYVEDVADFTLSQMLNLYRRTFWQAKAVIDARKPITADQVRDTAVGTRRMRGSVLGLLGCGRVGTAVGLRAKAFGMQVIFYDPFVREGTDRALGFERIRNLDEFFARLDCLSLHCPVKDDTRQIINTVTLKQMRPGCFIINTSEPGLICETALANALKTGHVRAAALDSHESIPTDANPLNPLHNVPNLINTPRAAWMNEASCKELRIVAAKEIRKALTGRCPQDLLYCVNRDAVIQNGTQLPRRTSNPHPLMNMGNFGLPSFPPISMAGHFPYANPLLAMGAQMGALNPLLMNNAALAQFNSAAALSSFAAAHAAQNQRNSPAVQSSQSSPSPHTNKSSVSPVNGISKSSAPSPAIKIELSQPKEDAANGNNGEMCSSISGESGSETTEKVKMEGDDDDHPMENEIIDRGQLNIEKLDQPEEINVTMNGRLVNVDDSMCA